ncbi:sulfurtransferase [Bacillus sp. CECT 9360]|uniref:sulfurtransferase n=1 Tax=Bacillus sp. CECT 9360 TaxID=2845821 RepID=UPI001E3EA132|nr:sulfurtransferase [Bacillus sp. CECT 9360]
MILLLLILSFLLLASFIYKRYYPIKNIPCMDKDNMLKNHGMTILDIRDYNEPTSNRHSLNIPYAYLARFYKEIPHGKIHVLASNRLELNLGVRFLKRKGINVASYELIDCPCKKEVLDYGV